MGIFDALNTAVGGLQSESFALQNISGNIANSSTVGFRQRVLQFQDMIYQNLVTPGAAKSQQTVTRSVVRHLDLRTTRPH